jgi:succinyl-diaminopimelate desuccinylase
LAAEWQGLPGAATARSVAPMEQDQALTQTVAARKDDLVTLTRDLVRIPTLNPPGRNYREICDYLGARLGKRGFSV